MMPFLIYLHIIGLFATMVWMICTFAGEWKELYSKKK